VLLAVDIGNTNVTLGFFEQSALAFEFRLETSRSKTSDEYAISLRQLLSLADIDAKAIAACIVASVVPSLTGTFAHAVDRTFGLAPIFVEPGIKTGIALHMDHPREVGADRIVNAVAAHDRIVRSGAANGYIVVDFGTATTFDVVSPKGEYLGGAICPGILISADALFVRAAKLPRVDIARPPKVVGKNTLHAMQSGLFFGYAAMVDGLFDRLSSELPFAVRGLATGGLATSLAPECRNIHEVDPHLTLHGLRLIYERNRA
jgi:type III pantothenate kinase